MHFSWKMKKVSFFNFFDEFLLHIQVDMDVGRMFCWEFIEFLKIIEINKSCNL